ncbi:hypothetical protein [Thiosulfativibrio zosterae]|uniref:HPt domain-containing protein n=1 Tax=Thiosulfativibrio zosterae TaxID=2675053 RepID=A0A6F8PQL7_9GAMM|nr:hypothetical protein [Thiosulfativibrio zosterae]BBP44405.1 hypothetical protein THMIRHAT_21510 [Thiosulfativibrio zosterae]
MIDLEAFNFLYDYEHLSAAHKESLITDLMKQSEQVLSVVQQASLALPEQGAAYIAQVHQAKSTALVLCADEINAVLEKMNKTPVDELSMGKVANDLSRLADLIKAYQQDLELLKAFVV